MAVKTVRCELQTWQTTTSADGALNKVLVDNAGDKKQDEDIYALVLHRVLEFATNNETVTLTVNSPHILKALHDVVKLHPSVSGDFTKSTEIKGPFQVLVYYWDDIFKYAEDVEDDTAHMHLNLLIDFMSSELGAKKRDLDHQHSLGMCQFAGLWAVFKPGEIAFTREKQNPWLLKIVKTGYEESAQAGKYLELQCVYTDHNGASAGDVKQNFLLKKKDYFSQDDPAKITDLHIYPRIYHEQDGELEKSLIERGKRYLELSKAPSVKNYDGTALYAKTPPPTWFDLDAGQDPKTWVSYTETGRVVIDRKGYGEEHVPPVLIPRRDLTEEALSFCPPYTYGYSCARKAWCRFFLPSIYEATWKPDPFGQLVLQENQKTLVRALVSSHEFPENPRDQTLQKGKGLVCLLHGTPGSGKTLTAECAAEHTHKALFSCTMSELNEYNSPSWFEERLARVLRLATAWKAIILLDEADVFLEARQDSNSTERNALVAVLLRQMEYFSGIVFLTTNRIQVFDQAMRSRVHLALAFTSPDRPARRLIWQNQLRRLAKGVVRADIDHIITAVQDEEMNGREIANAILTATTLARYNEEALNLGHIETVISVRRDFTSQLKQIARASSAQYPIRQNSMLNDVLSEEPGEI